MKKRAHLLISGKVKGVGYKVFVSEVALSHALTGYVIDTPDSNVEVVFEGDKKPIDAAIKKCFEGIPSAVIKGFHIEWEDNIEHYKTFMIRY